MSELRRAICARIDQASAMCARLSGAFLCAAILCAALNALLRFGAHITSAATLELQSYLFSAVFLLSAAHVLHLGLHIRIDVLHARLSTRTQQRIMLIGHMFFSIPLCAALIITSAQFAWRSYVSQETSINVGGLLLWPAKILIPLSFCLILLQALAELMRPSDGQQG